MAIHDTDKNHDQRIAPQPANKDVSASRPAHGTNSANYVTPDTALPEQGVNTGVAGGGDVIKYGFKRLALKVPITVTNDGSAVTTASVEHGLDFVPKVEAYFEDATVGSASGAIANSAVPLPAYTDASIDTVDGAAMFSTNDLPIVALQTYFFAWANDERVWVQCLNSTGTPVTITVTCYLYQL